MTTEALLTSVGKQQARFVSLVYRLQHERLKYTRLVRHYQAICGRWNGSPTAVALPPVLLRRFVRDEHGIRVMRTVPDIGGGDERHDDWFRGARPASGFALTRRPVAGGVCLAIVGEVDLANATHFLAGLEAVAANDQDLVVDLSGARYLDSSGVRALFTAYRAFRIRKLRLSLSGATATVKKVLDIVDAAQLMPVFDTTEAALRDLAEHT